MKIRFRLPVEPGPSYDFRPMNAAPPIGVLLLQLGTPDSPSTSDVRRYLREFLSDPRVLDMAAPLRALLLNAVILPFRPRKSAHAYRQIWTDDGSPLMIHTEHLTAKVADILGDQYRVEFGMRYQNPSIASALDRLVESRCERMIVLPLFPQYASASGGSAVAKTLQLAAERWNVPDVSTIGAFYDDPGYVTSVAAVTRPELESFQPDHVLVSYHGLPEKQIHKSDPERLMVPVCGFMLRRDQQRQPLLLSGSVLRHNTRPCRCLRSRRRHLFDRFSVSPGWPEVDRAVHRLRDAGATRTGRKPPSRDLAFIRCRLSRDPRGAGDSWPSAVDGPGRNRLRPDLVRQCQRSVGRRCGLTRANPIGPGMTDSPDRSAVETWYRDLQDRMCVALVEVDGGRAHVRRNKVGPT